MSDKLYCTYCGALNDADALFCERCGHALERVIVPVEDAAESGSAVPAGEEGDLLSELMEEPVTAIPEEAPDPAPAKDNLPKGLAAEMAAAEEYAAGDPAFEPSDFPPKEQTQVFSRSDLEAAIAADSSREREERARALKRQKEAERAKQKEAERAKQKERLLEESRRHQEYERMRQEEQRAERLRRKQEEALYAEFEQPSGGGPGGERYGQYAQEGYGGYAQGQYGQYADDGYQNGVPAKKKRRILIPVLIIILLLAAGGFCAWKFLLDKTTVDLTHNITSQDIYFDGYDGSAIVIYDEEVFRARADYPRGNEKAEQFMDSVSYTVEPSSGLSNGDKVTVRALVSEETAKSLHINVKGEEKEFEVEGLEEEPSIDWDPFGLFTDDDEDEDKKDEAAGDTLIPEIDSRYYTDSDVAGKNNADIQNMINELYARHGYIFKDQTLQDSYEKQSWYKGTTNDAGKVEQSFNAYEKKNLEFLSDKRD